MSLLLSTRWFKLLNCEVLRLGRGVSAAQRRAGAAARLLFGGCNSLVAVVGVHCASALVQAAPADRMAPLQIEADAVVHDSVRGNSVFTGNVLMHKGSIELRADKAEVNQDELGFQIAYAYGSAQRRAFFRQENQTPGEYLEAEGERLLFNSRSGDLDIYNRAEVRRFRGVQLMDVAEGPHIHYNNMTEVYALNGAPAAVNLPGEAQAVAVPPGRVRLVLTPHNSPHNGSAKKDEPSRNPATVPLAPRAPSMLPATPGPLPKPLKP